MVHIVICHLFKTFEVWKNGTTSPESKPSLTTLNMCQYSENPTQMFCRGI